MFWFLYEDSISLLFIKESRFPPPPRLLGVLGMGEVAIVLRNLLIKINVNLIAGMPF